jgi:hypothetical protein
MPNIMLSESGKEVRIEQISCSLGDGLYHRSLEIGLNQGKCRPYGTHNKKGA